MRALMPQTRGGLPRAELAAETGICKPAAGQSARRLAEAGLMADTGPLEGALPGVQDLPQPSRPIRIPREARWAVSLRKLQCVNGRPSFSGRVVAAATMTSMSASLIRRGRPPAHRGSSAARPLR